MPSPNRVVLLRDGSWPAAGDGELPATEQPADLAPADLATALQAIGAAPAVHTCHPYRPRASAVRRTGRLRRLAADRRHRAELRPALVGATLVVAGSPAAATVAHACGVPWQRLWVLAAPLAGGYGGSEVAALAAGGAGFVVGSEEDRGWLERLTAGHRTRVVVCPPADAVAQRSALRQLLAMVAPQEPDRPRPARSVLVAGYDLKFATDLAGQLDRRTDLAVTVDDWPELGRGTRHTAARLRRADAVLAEWARTSAGWLSRNARPDQFLAVRLHRYELDFPYPRQIAVENVDAMVYIAPLFGRRIREELGWPTDKLVYIPNYIDLDWFSRPKLPGVQFTLGFVGLEWSRKRFDLALDLLAALRQEDDRFTMVVRSTLPWHNQYAWANPTERSFVAQWCSRLDQDPRLREAVQFDAPGQDMARWYRRVGHIVSTSDAEGSHTAVAEAMAAGSVPVIRAWPGAAEVYDAEWVHTGTDAAAAAVLKSADPDEWQRRADRARAEVHRTHNPDAVVAAWADLLHGDLPAARTHFDDYLEGTR